MPDIQISLAAVLIATVVHFFFGFIWYTYLFGRLWAREMGFNPDEQPDTKTMLRGMSLMVLGNFLMAWVLAYNIAAWNPQTWGLGPPEFPTFAQAGMAAFFTWLGFIVPLLLIRVAWEKKTWTLFGIDGSYHLLSLLIVANILVHW